MPKILIADTYYHDFLQFVPFDANSNYTVELHKLLDYKFGTSDFYSSNLRTLGWDAVDVVANHEGLQQMWARDGHHYGDILESQIREFAPDVVFLQDLTLAESVPDLPGVVIAAQCSCPMPADRMLKRCDVVFTSFPHYLKPFADIGIKAIYLPLAFESSIISRVGGMPEERPIDVAFVGGVGNPSHWRRGTETLETIARQIPKFKWWGYGVQTLPADSALYGKYQGPAWGLDMYTVLAQSKIVLNRHGEVAQGYANNLRLYEATGMGAMLLTEEALNLGELFVESNGLNRKPEVVSYVSPDEAARLIEDLLDENVFRDTVALNGQQRTLRDHTYAQRMKIVDRMLRETLNAKA